MIPPKWFFFTGIMVLYELILNFFNLTDFYSKRRNHKTKYKRLLTDAEKLKSGKVLEMSDVTDSYILVTGQQLSLQSERNRFN